VTREQKIAKAKRLREQGLTYQQIAERLNVSSNGVVSRWLNPERAKEADRRSNAKRNDYKRQWDRDNRAECPRCGGAMCAGSRSPSHCPDRCWECLRDEADARIRRFIALRREGLLNPEIAEREGTTVPAVAMTLSNARRQGYDVPPSPYGPAAARDAA